MFNWDMNHPLFWESTRSISRGWILVPRSGAAIGGCRIYVKVCMIRSRSTTVPGMEKPNCFPVFKESPPKISLIGPDLKKMRHRNDASEDLTGCWFQTCLEFSISYMGQSFPLTFIFFKMVKTTNQLNLWQRIRICQDPLEHTLQSPDRKSVKTWPTSGIQASTVGKVEVLPFMRDWERNLAISHQKSL